MKKVSLILSAALVTIVLTSSFDGFSQEESTSEEVTIGKQVWRDENLNVDKFRNGDPIPEAKTAKEWEKAGENKQPAWCYHKNAPANGGKYGKLYNWYAVIDPRGLAPVGYHIPTDAEWTKLSVYLGGESVAGTKMKSTSEWKEDGNGTNDTGFSGLPGGFRSTSGEAFFDFGNYGYWWSSTEVNTFNAWSRNLFNINGTLHSASNKKGIGCSVRCLRD